MIKQNNVSTHTLLRGGATAQSAELHSNLADTLARGGHKFAVILEGDVVAAAHRLHERGTLARTDTFAILAACSKVTMNILARVALATLDHRNHLLVGARMLLQLALVRVGDHVRAADRLEFVLAVARTHTASPRADGVTLRVELTVDILTAN